MENKNITLESLINYDADYLPRKQQREITDFFIKDYEARNRERENARALVEEIRREREKRVVSQISPAAYFGTSRPHLFNAPGDYIFRGDKNYFEDAKENPTVGTCQIAIPGFLCVCNR